jgi:outer membrane protein OmpA-like peptidoglycan-associated protein
MSHTIFLILILLGARAALSAEGVPDLLTARPQSASDVVEQNVRQVARIRIATASILSGGEMEGSIDVEGKATETMLAFYRPATAMQIAEYYTRELERRHARVMFRCEDQNCGLGGFSHWPGSYSSYAAGNTKSQIYIAARLTEGSEETYVTVHAVENTSSYLSSRPRAAGTVFIQGVSGRVIGSKTASAIAIEHYPGAHIQSRSVREFDEIAVYFSAKTASAKPKILSGKVAITVLTAPGDRSLAEVFHNYKSAVESAGFAVAFSCRDRECGDGMEDFYLHSDVVRRITDISKSQYLAARRERDGKVDHIYVFARTLGKGIDIKIGTVEGKEIESGLVSIRASQILSDIASSGRAAIYGILFDTDQARIKPESQPILDEIAKALKQDRRMNLLIVGHTDNVGTAEYNLDLSRRRAQAIRAALEESYGIESKRLAAYGVGLLSPVASNKSEEGRVRNRRVELVER